MQDDCCIVYISFSPQRCSSLHSDMFNSSFTFLVFILLISKDITDNKKEKFFSISFVIAHTYSQKKNKRDLGHD